MPSFQKKLFHWCEELGITTAERRVILILCSLLLCIKVLKLWVPKPENTKALEALVIDTQMNEEHIKSHKDVVVDSIALVQTIEDFNTKSMLKSSDVPSSISNVTTTIAINTATVEQLQQLPGVGPTIAKRIVKYREEYGLFTTLQQLTEVRGIGNATLQKLTPRIVIDLQE